MKKQAIIIFVFKESCFFSTFSPSVFGVVLFNGFKHFYYICFQKNMSMQLRVLLDFLENFNDEIGI